MGTVLQLTLCGTDPDQTRHTSDSLFQTAAHLDRLLTTYAPDSPVSRLNATAGQGAMPVPGRGHGRAVPVGSLLGADRRHV